LRFLIFIFAFLFIAAIFFVRDEILSKRAKIIATTLIMLLCAGAYFYESASERSAKLEEEMVFKFNAGARLRCGGAINSAAEARGAADSFSEKHSADTKNLGAKADEANLNAQDEAASAAQSFAMQTNEQASAVQTSGAVLGGQNSAQSPTSQNSVGQNDTQSLTPQNSASQGGMRSPASQNSTQSSAQRGDVQTYSPQSSAQNSKTTQNSAPQNLNLQGSAQIVTRENFTYSFSLGAFIAKKSAGAEFKGKTYKIKECVYDQ
jgi:hypothetical protein